MVGRIVSSSNTLPILSNLLLKTENGTLKISSTNLEIAITTQVRCKVEEEGETTVSSKTLTDLISNMPSKNITLLTDSGQLKIDTENYHTSIKTLPAEDFPLIPKVEGSAPLKFDSQELKKALDEVVFAASSNQTQPEISGVFFSVEKGVLKIVATDRYRLAEKTMAVSKTSTQEAVIVPQKTVAELSRIIGNQKGEVLMVCNHNQATLSFNDTEIISRLVDGQYPDYRQIIPQEFKTTAVTEKTSLISALRAAAVFSQSSNSVKFEMVESRQVLVLTAESAELGKSVVELPANIQGVGGEIVFNYHYVLDCLAGVETANVVIKTIDDNSPGLILPEEKTDYIYLIMPIKS